MSKKIQCPICKKETTWENNPFRPFCSERCQTRDLGNWAIGGYSVPVEEDGEIQETQAEERFS